MRSNGFPIQVVDEDEVMYELVTMSAGVCTRETDKMEVDGHGQRYAPSNTHLPVDCNNDVVMDAPIETLYKRTINSQRTGTPGLFQ